jgi:hypothetical protein
MPDPYAVTANLPGSVPIGQVMASATSVAGSSDCLLSAHSWPDILAIMKHRRSLSDQAYARGLRALSDDPNNQNGIDKTWVLHFIRRLERLFKNARPIAKSRHGRVR